MIESLKLGRVALHWPCSAGLFEDAEGGREEGKEERRGQRREVVGAGRWNRREGGRRRWRWMRVGGDDAGGGSRAGLLEEGVRRWR
jgi:hypothetical protein